MNHIAFFEDHHGGRVAVDVRFVTGVHASLVNGFTSLYVNGAHFCGVKGFTVDVIDVLWPHFVVPSDDAGPKPIEIGEDALANLIQDAVLDAIQVSEPQRDSAGQVAFNAAASAADAIIAKFRVFKREEPDGSAE